MKTYDSLQYSITFSLQHGRQLLLRLLQTTHQHPHTHTPCGGKQPQEAKVRTADSAANNWGTSAGGRLRCRWCRLQAMRASVSSLSTPVSVDVANASSTRSNTVRSKMAGVFLHRGIIGLIQ